MIKPQKEIHSYQINASVWLRDEQSFTVVENLDHTPRMREDSAIATGRWAINGRMDRMSCDRVVSQGQDHRRPQDQHL